MHHLQPISGSCGARRSRAPRFVHGILLVALVLAWTPPVQADDDDNRFNRSPVQVDVPAVTLVDQHGDPVLLRDVLLADRPVLVEFIFASCTTVCPVMSAGYASVQRKLGDDGGRVSLVSITIDPEHDTPGELRKYLERYRARPGWTFLTGTREQIDQVMRAFDAYVTNKMAHRPLTFVHSPGSDRWVRLQGFVGSADLLEEIHEAEKHEDGHDGERGES